ncbi:alpha-amylase family glycosyl hydrolase [Streptomyces sp. G5(2025)]|uniref:alpha-amylase family glycosyl hydrolase n=1 Tax=Streptomyces sp. G5(2025) TaxID=3406628 RepID=UPI003C2136BD
MSERPWWRDAVIYHIYPRSFLDTNGDGSGDLPGVTARLPYLADLGVDALWLSPFYLSPMEDFGYDITDHTAVDPLFGKLDDFDTLVETAHAHGVKVLIDYVPNHTSSRHRWFLDSQRGRTDPRRDWYVWRDPAPGGGPPNNWITLFGEPAWSPHPESGQYYLHSFLPSMPDLNWRHPEVRRAMLDVARFWLDRGVDGYRIDCVPLVAKDPLFRDNPPAEPLAMAQHRPMGAYDGQRHIHDQGHPDLHDIYRSLRALLDSYGSGQERVAIGEIHEHDWPLWSTFFGQDLDEIHLPLNFGLLKAPWRPADVEKLLRDVQDALPAGATPAWVLGSHDEPRVASRIGAAQARNAMMLLLTLPGTALLYYGDELGLPNGELAAHRAQDPWGVRDQSLSRDPARTPMPWTPGPTAGFTRAPAEPWLPVVVPEGGSAAEQVTDPTSFLALTRSLLRLRHDHPALAGDALEFQSGLPEGVLGYQRRGHRPGDALLVMLNFTDRAVRLPRAHGGPAAAGRWVRLVSTCPEPGPGQAVDALAPHEGVICGPRPAAGHERMPNGAA